MLGYIFRNRLPLERALTHISALKATAAGRTAITSGSSFSAIGCLGLRRRVALSVLSRGQRGRAFAPSRPPRSARDLRRSGVANGISGPYIRLGAGRNRFRSAQERSDPRRCLRGRACGGLSGRRIRGGPRSRRSRVVRPEDDRSRPRAARPQVDVAGMGAWAAQSPRQSTARSSDPAPTISPMFRIAAMVEGHEPCEGEGRSKRLAEQAAAEAFLRREGVTGKAMA